MSAKPTGLSAFSQKAESEPAAKPSGKRPRAQGETVALTLRVSRPEWQRLRGLADSEGLTLTDILKSGLSGEMEKRGLPPLSE